MFDTDAGTLWFYVPAVLLVYGLILAVRAADGDGSSGAAPGGQDGGDHGGVVRNREVDGPRIRADGA